jgi:hypothetical protein
VPSDATLTRSMVPAADAEAATLVANARLRTKIPLINLGIFVFLRIITIG